MSLIAFLISFVISATGVTITEPEDLAAYNLDELPAIRAIVENENVIPDSVHYSLNGAAVVPVPRLNTDWPTYMQNYQNHGYSESPAVTDNTILWTAPVTGDFHEFPTPVVVDGIVYYPQDGSGDSLYALNAATGELIWKYRTGYTDDAVTVHEGYVYTPSDSLWCLDALTGERIWAFGEANDRGGTPIVIDNMVFCAARISNDSTYVYRLDASTGEVEWSQAITGAATSCMGLWNNSLIVPTFKTDNLSPLVALDTETGEILWENYDSFSGYWDSSPVIVDGVVYITGIMDGIVRAIDAGTGVTSWEAGISLWPHESTMSYHNGLLYSAIGCIETIAGGVIWEAPQYYFQHGSSGIAGGLLSFGETVPDTASFITLNCSDGSEAWRYQTASGPMGIVSSPSIVDGVMYIAGTDWNLYAFGTGLKYTYLDEALNPEVGWNELVATSFDNGVAVASDTVNFYINPTGIKFEPSRRLLLTGSPNPFSSSTELSFSLSAPGFTSVEIYDLTGRCISNLVDNDLSQGDHTVNWGGTDQNGNGVPPGLYMCRIQSGGVIETTGLCLLR